MAEQNDHSKKQSSSKSNSPQHKPTHDRNKHPGVNKAQNIFGVSDLRELLNKKRNEYGAKDDTIPKERAKADNPPPDPRYGYLRDPLRDSRPQSKETKTVKIVNKKGSKKYPNVDEKANLKRDNLPNIKVELRVATGSRNCVVDEASRIKPLNRISETSMHSNRSQEGHGSGSRFRKEPIHDDRARQRPKTSNQRVNFEKKAQGKEDQRKLNLDDSRFTEGGGKGVRDAGGEGNDESVAYLEEKLRGTLVIESSTKVSNYGSGARDEVDSGSTAEAI
ncbi:uncharacterized protein LOC132704366 [Cylas formicarius]|uniref:uncharacterized protein LOC132704366 n=1 Tax=Cylas formicarius TaxID=197179 RepID=UPI0029585489|nr:uncharacterized protein LOC132704366 [Cylas formicarius]